MIDGVWANAYRKYRIDVSGEKGFEAFYLKAFNYVIELFSKETETRAVKAQLTAWIRFIKEDDIETEEHRLERADLAFNSRMGEIYGDSNMESLYERMTDEIKYQIENPALKDSKFVLDRVLYMDINFHTFNLTRGSSYIKLPSRLDSKKAIINPNNEDNRCFKWAVIAAMKWETTGSNPQRISKLKKYEELFDWSGIHFPTPIKDVGILRPTMKYA